MTILENLTATIELFKAGKTGKNGNFFAVKNAVVYRDIKERAGLFETVQDVLVIRTNSGVLLGNSSRLTNLEDKRYTTKIEPSTVQRILSETMSMIPFSVFQEAGIDLMTCEIVDAGPVETLTEKVEEWEYDKNEFQNKRVLKEISRHYTGARLFKADQKNAPMGMIETKYFLCDVDRREVEHGIINFFLAELPEKCGSISEAYEMLKPEEVKTFEKNTGVTVERQGEFFFIPTNLGDDISDKTRPIREIRVGNSRPNRVEKGFEFAGKFYVTGTIEHTGREHAPLVLPIDRWFKVVPNTSKANFQLTGDID